MFHHLLTWLIKIWNALWGTHSHFLHACFLLVTKVSISRQWLANDSAPTSERNNKIDCQSENGSWFSWLTSKNSPWNLLSIYYSVQWFISSWVIYSAEQHIAWRHVPKCLNLSAMNSFHPFWPCVHSYRNLRSKNLPTQIWRGGRRYRMVGNGGEPIFLPQEPFWVSQTLISPKLHKQDDKAGS